MISVYIGGSFAARKRIAEVAAKLEKRGYLVLSRWFDEEYFIEKAWDNNFAGEVAEGMARLDFSQILQAKLIIIDSLEKSTTGGYHVELGMGLILNALHGIRLVHIGTINNIFQNMALEHYDSWNDFFKVN